eukprot:gene6851-9382_t
MLRIREAELKALKEVYTCLNIPPEHWTARNDVNLWDGLTIEEGKIIGIDFTFLNVADGTLSDKIGDLTNLKFIRGGGTDGFQISGALPESIGKLKNLHELSIYCHRISGTIPSCLSELTNLNILNLDSNHLTGTIPNWIGNLTNLINLSLSSNQLTGHIPQCITNLTSLIDLSLYDNQLTGSIPVGLANIKPLIQLRLDGNYLSGNGNHVSIEILKLLNSSSQPSLDWSYVTSRQSVESIATFEPWMFELFPHILLFAPAEAFSLAEKSPITFYNRNKDDLIDFMKKLCINQNTHIVQCMCTLRTALTIASQYHLEEELELQAAADRIEQMVLAILNCDSMDDAENVLKVLILHNFSNHSELNNRDFHNYNIRAETLLSNNVLGYCLDYDLKAIFGTPQVSSIVSHLFNSYLNRGMETEEFFLRNNISYFSKIFFRFDGLFSYESKEEVNNTFTRNYKVLNQLRYSPRFMFFAEGFSKSAVIILVALVSIKSFTKSNSNSNIGESQGYDLSGSQQSITASNNVFASYWLLLMLSSCILYEIGQIMQSGHVLDHFKDVWNRIDLITYTLIAIWAASFQFQEFTIFCRGALALAAIPASLSLFQYISMWKTFGTLVLMIIALFKDLVTFAIIFFVWISGFGITFMGLYYPVSQNFSSIGFTFLTLFSAALSNYDLNQFSFNSQYEYVGISILTVFIVLTAILLLNILIARMSSTHNRIEVNSVREWSFVKAETTRQYQTTSETNPLCMLPAPLNLITSAIFFLPFIKYPSNNKQQHDLFISIQGTIADYTLRILVSPLQAIYTMIIFYSVTPFAQEFHAKEKKLFFDYINFGMFFIISSIIIFPIILPMTILSSFVSIFNRNYDAVVHKHYNTNDQSAKNKYYFVHCTTCTPANNNGRSRSRAISRRNTHISKRHLTSHEDMKYSTGINHLKKFVIENTVGVDHHTHHNHTRKTQYDVLTTRAHQPNKVYPVAFGSFDQTDGSPRQRKSSIASNKSQTLGKSGSGLKIEGAIPCLNDDNDKSTDSFVEDRTKLEIHENQDDSNISSSSRSSLRDSIVWSAGIAATSTALTSVLTRISSMAPSSGFDDNNHSRVSITNGSEQHHRSRLSIDLSLNPDHGKSKAVMGRIDKLAVAKINDEMNNRQKASEKKLLFSEADIIRIFSDVNSLDSQLGSLEESLDDKFTSVVSKIKAVETNLDHKIERIENRMNQIESNVGLILLLLQQQAQVQGQVPVQNQHTCDPVVSQQPPQASPRLTFSDAKSEPEIGHFLDEILSMS